MSLLKRILAEKRALIVPLAVGLGVNLALYALAVYPLTIKVRGAEDRAAVAAQRLRSATAARVAARSTLEGKTQADAELRKFYKDVLPVDLTGARRLTYAKLAQLARDANLRPERRSVTTDSDRDSPLTRVRTTMVLAGDYRNIRRFIYALETAPEFVVIEDVSLAQSEERNAPLVLTLQVSTYYWAGGNGS